MRREGLGMRGRIHITRSYAILRVKRRLEYHAFPRLQMALIVALTGAAGLLFSFLMLEAGVTSMALRYPLALLLAYAVFLVLLWLWLRTSADDYLDIPDFSGAGSGRSGPTFEGGGGNFGGGGASGSFDDPGGSLELETSPLAEAASAVGDGADELAIPLVVVALALGLAFASLYVVYAAPILFAELLVDGVLSYALYRRIKAVDTPHWLESAVRRTALPLVLTGVFVSAGGAAMAAYAPGAQSIGQVVHHDPANR